MGSLSYHYEALVMRVLHHITGLLLFLLGHSNEMVYRSHHWVIIMRT